MVVCAVPVALGGLERGGEVVQEKIVGGGDERTGTLDEREVHHQLAKVEMRGRRVSELFQSEESDISLAGEAG